MSPVVPHSDPTPGLTAWLNEGRCRPVLEWYRTAAPEMLAQYPRALTLVATAAARTADYAVAEELAERARVAALESDDRREYLKALNLLGGIAFERGRTIEASEWYEEAYAAAKAAENLEMLARLCNNLASIRHLRGQSDQAELLYLEAVGRYRAMNDARGLAETHHNLAILHRTAGRHHDAEEAAARAREHAGTAGDPALLGMTLAGQAEANLSAPESEIDRLLAEASQLAREGEDAVGAIEVRRLRATVRLRQQDSAGAAFVAETALAEASRRGSLLQYAECALVAAEAWDDLGWTEVARLRRSEADRVLEGVGAAHRIRGESPNPVDARDELGANGG